MPGPMSVPNGSNRYYNVGTTEKPRWVSIHDLTGEQRVRLAERGKLDTGKTRRKRE